MPNIGTAITTVFRWQGLPTLWWKNSQCTCHHQVSILVAITTCTNNLGCVGYTCQLITWRSQCTVITLRQTFWITSVRRFIRSVLRTCVTCKRVCGKPYSTPDPWPLPKSRTQLAPPFTVTGVDFTGALYVRVKVEKKRLIFAYSLMPIPDPSI